jgi:cytosine/uracil/thiamine/allantoin permease
VTQPTTFITVLSGWSVFLSPMTGLVVSDYFLVRRRQYHLGDLYTGNSTSAYWYIAGFNWRGFTAWATGIWPVLPGFVKAIEGVNNNSGWDHIYEVCSGVMPSHPMTIRLLIMSVDHLLLWLLVSVVSILGFTHSISCSSPDRLLTIRACGSC